MKTKNDDKGWVTVDKDGNHKPINERETFVENGEKFTPYAVSKTYKIPLWIKACFAKWWFAGAVFYFIFFGFGDVVQGDVLAIILGLVLGLATDFVLNHFYRDLSAPNHDYTKYIFCGKHRKYVTLPINLVYYVALAYVGYLIILGLNFFCEKHFGWDPDVFMFTAGAVIYATIMLVLDLIITSIRNFIDKIIEKRKIANNNSEINSTENEKDSNN